MKQLECSVTGCDNPHHAKGLCKVHYSQQRRRRRSGRAAASAPEPVVVPEQVTVEAAAVTVATREAPATDARSSTRLEELRRRYERMKREIARIAETFDTEVDTEVEEE